MLKFVGLGIVIICIVIVGRMSLAKSIRIETKPSQHCGQQMEMKWILH